LFLKPTENSKPARECICIHGIHGSYIKVAFQRRKSECGLLGATVFVSLGTGSWNLETVTAEAAGQTIVSSALHLEQLRIIHYKRPDSPFIQVSTAKRMKSSWECENEGKLWAADFMECFLIDFHSIVI